MDSDGSIGITAIGLLPETMTGELWEVEPTAGDRWIVRKAGSLEMESTHASIEEAIEQARKLAREQNGDARIRDRGGRITEHWMFRDLGRSS